MKEEAYNLVCRGELLPGFEQSAVISQVAKLFTVGEAKAVQILDKTPRVLMKRVKWEQAVKYRNLLKSIGLVIHVNVLLDADVFRESLVPVSHQAAESHSKENEKSVPDKSPEIELQMMELDITHLVPAMFAKAHSETLLDSDRKPKFNLESYNYWLNPRFLLLVSLFAALIVQKYFGLLLVQVASSLLVTPLLVLLFFLIIIFLPRIMSPNRVFTLRDAKDGSAYLMCAQTPGLNPFVYGYHVYSCGEEMLAVVRLNKLKNRIECWGVDGNILYSSSEEHYVDDVTKDVAIEIRDELFDFSAVTYINQLSRRLRKLKAWYKKEPQTYKRSDAFVVRNNNAKKVAYFHRDNRSVIEFPVRKNGEGENKALLAFLLICLGVD